MRSVLVLAWVWGAMTLAVARKTPQRALHHGRRSAAELAAWGRKHVISPHVDALAKRGRLFTRAYCQQAVCNPSRASMMTGLQPDTLRIWDLPTHLRDRRPEVITLPQHFKNHGYFTQGIGKLFPIGGRKLRRPKVWSVPKVMHFARHGDDKPVSPDPGQLPPNLSRNPIHRAVPDSAYFDGRIADLAIDALEQLKKKQQPFFWRGILEAAFAVQRAEEILGPLRSRKAAAARQSTTTHQRAGHRLSRCPRNASIFRRQTTNTRPTPRTTPRLLCHHQLYGCPYSACLPN